jgi:hypothetical protein
MKRISILCAFASLLLTACNKSGEPGNSSTANPSSGSLLTAPVDYLKSAADADHSATKTIDTTSVNEAIQLFYTDKGRYPKDLNELVTEKYMAKVPIPPFGTRLDYDPVAGTVKVVNQ